MGWDAALECDCCHSERGWWNFTHNTNRMITTVLEEDDGEWPIDTRHWWIPLAGLSGPEGAAYLHRIIKGLRADPPRFEAMNPPNAWGDYNGLLNVLTEMRDSVPEFPTHWHASG